MKDFPITLGIDDAKFLLKSSSTTTFLIGAVCQGTRLVNVLNIPIEIDGDDATQAIINLAKLTEKHVQYILTETITFGGFNVVDIEQIYNETQKPIISVTERRVDLESVKSALIKKFPDSYKSKLNKIINAGNLFETKIPTAGGDASIYFHVKGLDIVQAEQLLLKLCIDSKLPEPVRMAHIIGRLF